MVVNHKQEKWMKGGKERGREKQTHGEQKQVWGARGSLRVWSSEGVLEGGVGDPVRSLEILAYWEDLGL